MSGLKPPIKNFFLACSSVPCRHKSGDATRKKSETTNYISSYLWSYSRNQYIKSQWVKHTPLELQIVIIIVIYQSKKPNLWGEWLPIVKSLNWSPGHQFQGSKSEVIYLKYQYHPLLKFYLLQRFGPLFKIHRSFDVMLAPILVRNPRVPVRCKNVLFDGCYIADYTKYISLISWQKWAFPET